MNGYFTCNFSSSLLRTIGTFWVYAVQAYATNSSSIYVQHQNINSDSTFTISPLSTLEIINTQSLPSCLHVQVGWPIRSPVAYLGHPRRRTILLKMRLWPLCMCWIMWPVSRVSKTITFLESPTPICFFTTNFYGARTTIKGRLLSSRPRLKPFSGEKNSKSRWNGAQKWRFSGKMGV